MPLQRSTLFSADTKIVMILHCEEFGFLQMISIGISGVAKREQFCNTTTLSFLQESAISIGAKKEAV
jgi:hypothetical protein